MPTITPYRLMFHSGLHIGTRGVNREESGLTIGADTLFAAMLDAWRRSGQDPEVFVAAFPCKGKPAPETPPPFLLSSAFPFAGQVLFFPMPPDLSGLFSRQTLQKRVKDLKRIRFLSRGLLELALAGNKLDDELFPEDAKAIPPTGVGLQGGSLWLSKEEVKDLPAAMLPAKRHALRRQQLWQAEQRPRVAIDRWHNASTIYHVGRVSFAEGCGLWFGVDWRQPEQLVQAGGPDFKTAFQQVMAVLQDDGLGGMRSTGFGGFTWQTDAVPMTLGAAHPGELVYLLSRYYPTETELPAALTHPQAAYQLLNVGGWMRSPDSPAQRRKRTLFISEGSLVALPDTSAGCLVDVKPEYQNIAGNPLHPVYRSGLALSLPWPG